MQLTFSFSDDTAQQLQDLPNSAEFVNQAIKKALLNEAATEAKPSK